jgi:uncharacterized membrane protein (DUF485 family)
MKKSGFMSISIVLFWAGFVSSISFMEAWLKFQAPGVTISIGLSIGKTVFTALNRVEWVLLPGYVVFLLLSSNSKRADIAAVSVAIAVILIIQTFFLLPALVERANRIIDGQTVEKSLVHLLFGILEVFKVTGLIFLGFRLNHYQKKLVVRSKLIS